jgi:biopolymer transport protein ExbD
MVRYRFLKKRRAEEQDFELNIAPIIDCFMVVITFLLVSASFISLGVIDATSADATVPLDGSKAPQVELAIDLRTNRGITVSVSGDRNERLEIPPSMGSYNIPALTGMLVELKSRYATLNSANLNADAAVQYKDVIRALESVRGELPQVFLDPEAEK